LWRGLLWCYIPARSWHRCERMEVVVSVGMAFFLAFTMERVSIIGWSSGEFVRFKQGCCGCCGTLSVPSPLFADTGAIQPFHPQSHYDYPLHFRSLGRAEVCLWSGECFEKSWFLDCHSISLLLFKAWSFIDRPSFLHSTDSLFPQPKI